MGLALFMIDGAKSSPLRDLKSAAASWRPPLGGDEQMFGAKEQDPHAAQSYQ